MIEIAIPGRYTFTFHHVVIDVNGTLAVDGLLIAGVRELVDDLKNQCTLHLLTADSHGQQHIIDQQIGIAAQIITHGAVEKASIVRKLGAAHTVAIGNGANDAEMFQESALSIAVMGEEGLAVEALQAADVVVPRIHDALNLLLHTNRLYATLRR